MMNEVKEEFGGIWRDLYEAKIDEMFIPFDDEKIESYQIKSNQTILFL